MNSLDSAILRFEPVLLNSKKSEIGFEDLDLLRTKNKEKYKEKLSIFFQHLLLYVYNSLVQMP